MSASQAPNLDLVSDPTEPFTKAITETRRMLAAAPFVRTEQDLLEGYEYLAGRIRAAIQTAFTRYPDRPVILRTASQFTRLGLDNPDAIYISGDITDDADYVIHGRRGTSADLSMQLLSGTFVGSPPRPLDEFLGDLHVESDGTFSVLLSPDPRPDDLTEGNFLQLTPTTRRLIVREVFNDWDNEVPGSLWIERVDKRGVPNVPISRDSLYSQYELAAHTLLRTVELFLTFPEAHDFRGEFNVLTPLRNTPDGLSSQYSSSGRYGLAEDEALIITVPECVGCAYQAIQIGSEWFISTDYESHQSSLTKAQSHVDPDGKIRYVISEQNPGLANWLETQGHPTGPIFMRWQKPDRELTQDADGPTVEKVKFSDLEKALPYYSPISAEEYADRIARRQRAVAARGHS